jgi:hypothetical protein
MHRLALIALLLPTAMAGSKVIRTDAYKKARGLPSDLGVVLVSDATYVVQSRKSERVAIGAELCPKLVRYFRSTDTFNLVRCVVVPGGNVGEPRELPLGRESMELELPADGVSYAIDRREPAAVLFIEGLELLNTLDRETLASLDEWGTTAFKKPITLFARFGWWDNQAGALMGYQQLDATTAKVLYEGSEPQLDDLAWYLARELGAGMPFEFTW